MHALRGVLSSSTEVTRHVPASYLNHEPKSEAYRRFRAPLLVSDIVAATFDDYLAKVERCLAIGDDEIVHDDARTDYCLALEFQKIVSAGGARSLIA
jgi:hypothetical protein